MHGQEQEHLFALTANQKNIFGLEKAIQGTSVNNIGTAICVRGIIDMKKIQDAVIHVLKSDSSLRTQITEKNGDLYQYHAEIDFSAISTSEKVIDEDAFQKEFTSFTKQPIFAMDKPLYRFYIVCTGVDSAKVVTLVHHIISDGWTQLQLCNRICETYYSLVKSNTLPVFECPDYREFTERQARYLESSSYERDKKYWADQYLKTTEPAALRQNKGNAEQYQGRRVSFRLPNELNEKIYRFCLQKKVAPFSAFYLAMAIYLKRFGHGDRFTVGVPIYNRSTKDEKLTSGMFVSTMPFVNDISDDWTYEEFCENMTENWMELLRHQRFPYTDIERMAATGQPLFQVMLSYQDCTLFDSQDDTIRFSGLWEYAGYQAEQLCIHMTNLEGNRVYSVDYDYRVQYFTDEEIAWLHKSIEQILTYGIDHPNCKLAEIPLLGQRDSSYILEDFCGSSLPTDNQEPYLILEDYATKNPQKIAIIAGKEKISFEKLIQEGNRIAEKLTKTGALVAVRLPRNENLFYALVGIMRAKCVWTLLSMELPEDRVNTILQESGAQYLITTATNDQDINCTGGLRVQRLADSNDLDSRQKESLAYVVYTSGSTGKPKGVEIGNRAFCNLIDSMAPYYPDGTVLSICNVGFDAFLLESMVPLLNGKTIVFADDRQKENPSEIAELITKNGVEFIATTPSRLTSLMAYSEFRNAARGFKTIICGGEAFPPELLDCLKKETTAEIYNQYGPSETTVAVSMCKLNNASRITIGKPMKNCKLYVLDQQRNLLPPHVPGELYVGGACVGKGYRGNKQETDRVFVENPFAPGEKMYKTGDLTAWMDEGNIDICGRLDSQVKIRGLRIEPDEISNCMRRYPRLTGAAVRICEINGNPVIVGYYVSAEPIQETDLLVFLSKNLPNYMIPGVLLNVETIPLTPNGKLDTSRLPIPVMHSNVTAATDMQKQIVQIFKEDLHNDGIYADTNYFLAGGNSLSAMETVISLEKQFGIRLTVSELYACNTPEKLEGLLGSKNKKPEMPESVHAPEMAEYPTTKVQTGIYTESVQDKTGLTYMMPGGVILPLNIDLRRLESAIQKLVMTEPMLNVGFTVKNGELVAEKQEAQIHLDFCTDVEFSEVKTQLLKPFDLRRAPLMRTIIWESNGQKMLLFNIHHIIGDGLSTEILFRRLNAFYDETDYQIPYSYVDYVWSEKKTGTEGIQVEKWAERLSGCQTELELETGTSRPEKFDFHGTHTVYRFAKETTESVNRLCKEYNLTPYMVFVGALGFALSKLTRIPDILIGTPISQRKSSAYREICGPMVSTVPIRMKPIGKAADYWRGLKDFVLFAIDNSDISLSELISAMGIVPADNRNAMYQVLFQMRPIDPDEFTLAGTKLKYVPISTETSKLDFTMEAALEHGYYTIYAEYATSIFSQEVIHYYCSCLETAINLLSDINTNKSLEDLLLFEKPWQQSSRGFWQCDADAVIRPIPLEIEDVISQHPKETAVIWHDEIITYEELGRRADQIAMLLAQSGVQKGDKVGLCCKRTPDLLAALFAIMKSGAAYVPFLEDYPMSRIEDMLQIANVKLVLSDSLTAKKLPKQIAMRNVIDMNQKVQGVSSCAELNNEDAMYVLFTSGSSGKPKGVQLPYRALGNLLQQEKMILGQYPGPILCTTNITFDIFSTESVLALASGRTIILADETQMLMPNQIAELIRRYKPAVMQFTPSRLQLCLRDEHFCREMSTVSYTILVGEAVPPSLVDKFKECGGQNLGNWYGPTEAAVYVSKTELDMNQKITIGKPFVNCRIYVLDDNRKPVPPMTKGELYLAGQCLADGYISRSDLTDKVFVADPFFPGEKMYQTGDAGMLRLDENLECFGRLDSQIKINGNRVELQEIEEHIRNIGAKQAIVLPTKMEDGSTMLDAFVCTKDDADEIRNRLAQRLPRHMVPAGIHILEEMPVNASGKIDTSKLRSILKENVSSQNTSIDVSETTVDPEMVKSILSVWNSVLGRSQMEANVSFFLQGGSSLSALNVIMEYLARGWDMSLEAFYRYPTAVSQAELLAGVRKTEPNFGRGEDHRIGVVPQNNSEILWKNEEPHAVLLTGATGFLGAHILRELLKYPNEVYCLLRDGNTDRLRETLEGYFGEEWVRQNVAHIHTICGDICKDHLRMTEEFYNEVTHKIHAVYHCAADVRHYASDDSIEDTNVTGTRNVIAFAIDAGAVLFHISTASISANSCGDGQRKNYLFTENDLDIGQNWRDNAYISSKLRSEAEIYQAMSNGLKSKVFRIGRLIGRYTDGTFQKNPTTNAFYRIMKAASKIKVIPESWALLPLELSPVDVCAKAIISLCTRPEAVFHVVQREQQPLSEIIMDVIPDARMVSDEEFQKIIIEAAKEDADTMSSLVEFWNSGKNQHNNVILSVEATYRAMEESGFIWPKTVGNGLKVFNCQHSM